MNKYLDYLTSLQDMYEVQCSYVNAAEETK